MAEADLLLRALRLHARAEGQTASELVERAMAASRPAERVALLQRALRERIPDAAVRVALLDLLRGSYEQVRHVSPAVHKLVSMGLAQVSNVPMFRVRPVE